jgi:hypothetical protein
MQYELNVNTRDDEAIDPTYAEELEKSVKRVNIPHNE